MALGFDRQALAQARGHPDVEVTRIGRNALNRTALAPEITADDAYACAIVVMISGISAALTSW
jgi:hypothetical protein